MKENIDKLDQLFEKAFTGFEESPPAAVKSSVFWRILYFNAWRSLRKYVFILAILLMVGGIAWFSGAFSSGKSGQIASQNTYVDKKDINNIANQKHSTSNLTNTSFSKDNENSGPVHTKQDKMPVSDKPSVNDPKTNLDQSVNNTSLQQQEHKLNSTIANNKTLQYDNTNTSQLNTSNSQTSVVSNQQNATDNSVVNNNKSAEVKVDEVLPQNDIQPVKTPDSIEDILTQQPENLILEINDNSDQKENKKASLLWSVGLNLGHSLIQSDFIKTSEQASDELSAISAKMNFPSGFAGFSFRAEKRHFFFDFGLQYASFSEKISSTQLLYNAQPYQDISFLGQNMIIDSSGYWHYFYLSTTTITIIDSIWTLRNDTTLISLYDTAWLQRYDTLKYPSWINTYKQFEFPVNVGWMKNFGKVNLGFSTGPIFSLLVGSKGKMPYHINSGAELIATSQEFKAFKLAISWQITGLMNFQFNDRMTLELMPYYRRTLLPFKSSVSSAIMRNNSFGIQLGFRYYF